MSDNEISFEDALAPNGNSRSDSPPTISSEEILQGRREIFIEHEGQLYRLRVTSRGKLYLTK